MDVVKRSFIEKLDSNHEKFKESEITLENLIDSLNFYESAIPEFFSASGEAAGIKQMYTLIREKVNSDIEPTIKCSDINHGAHIYGEYLEGMINYIEDINKSFLGESASSDLVESFEEKISRVQKNDSAFIESIYGGELNENIDVPISEASTNVEFLIDFIPQLNSMKSNCISLNEKCELNKNNLVKRSLGMLYESVDNYCYSTLKNIINTYYDINLSLTAPKPLNKKYQLF